MIHLRMNNRSNDLVTLMYIAIIFLYNILENEGDSKGVVMFHNNDD